MKILAYTIATGKEWQRVVSATASAFKKFNPEVELVVFVNELPTPGLSKASEIHDFKIILLHLDERYRRFGHNFIQDYTRMEKGVELYLKSGYDYYLYFDADVLCMRSPDWAEFEEPMKQKKIILTPDHPDEGPKRLAYFKTTTFPKIPEQATVMLAYGSFFMFPDGSTLPVELIKEFGRAFGEHIPENEFYYMLAPAIVNMVIWNKYPFHIADRKWGEQVPGMMFEPQTIFEHIWWDKSTIVPTFRQIFGKDPWTV